MSRSTFLPRRVPALPMTFPIESETPAAFFVEMLGERNAPPVPVNEKSLISLSEVISALSALILTPSPRTVRASLSRLKRLTEPPTFMLFDGVTDSKS